MAFAKEVKKEEELKRVYQTLFHHIKNGEAAWQRSWKKGEIPLPFNLKTNKPYTGINNDILTCDARDNRFMTFKQMKDMGLSLRKGSKGYRCLRVIETPMKDKEGNPVLDRDGEPLFYRGLKAFTVFSVADMEDKKGILPTLNSAPPRDKDAPSLQAFVDSLRDNHGLKIVEQKGGNNQPCFSPKDNTVYMPPLEAFNNPDSYRATLLHEICHWAIEEKNKSSLGGDFELGFQKEKEKNHLSYAKEEIVVEMTAFALSSKLNLAHVPAENMANYVRSWSNAVPEKDIEALTSRLFKDSAKIVNLFEPELEKLQNKKKTQVKEAAKQLEGAER